VPPSQGGADALMPALLEAKVDSFLVSFVEPQRGHLVPFHFAERTRISLSASHRPQ
jgi:hypothetical protein